MTKLYRDMHSVLDCGGDSIRLCRSPIYSNVFVGCIRIPPKSRTGARPRSLPLLGESACWDLGRPARAESAAIPCPEIGRFLGMAHPPDSHRQGKADSEKRMGCRRVST